MTDNNINWDATVFFASLTEKNKFAKAHDFVFARVSGLDGFEEVLQQLQSATAIVGSYNIVVFLTICISYANNCFTL